MDYNRRFVTIIGSRETPPAELSLMRHTGQVLCDLGIVVVSGDADGADLAGYEGAAASPNYHPDMARIYLPWRHMVYHKTNRERWADGRTFIDSQALPNYEAAQKLAFDARGSFEGLQRGGIAMHTRNAYQILLDDLSHPVNSVICYAKPIGKKGNVKGGTNTAHRIALNYNVPILNLYKEEDFERLIQYLQRKERPW